jgi:hypothetical protein
MGLPILALWVVLGRWRASFSAVLVAAAIGGIAIGRLALADVEWLTSWIENVRKMTTEGGLNDYLTAKNPDDLLNIQVGLVRLLRERPITDHTTLILWTLLCAGTLAVMLTRRWRLRGAEIWLLSIVGLLTLIPVYHRTYDAIVLLPLLALSLAHLSAGRAVGWAGASLALLASLLVPAGLPNFLFRRGWVPPVEDFGWTPSIIYGHKGWCMLALAALLICWFWKQGGGQEPDLSKKNPDAVTEVA